MIATSIHLFLALSAPAQEPTWHDGPLEKALSAAAEEDTLVALYFHTRDSEHCQRMEETLASPAAVAELESLVCLRVDAASADGAPLLARYGVKTLPTIQFVDGQGRSQDALLGYFEGERFTAEVARIRSGKGTVGALRRALELAPDDLGRRLQLALKLQYVGDTADYQQELETIHERDPEGKTLAGARVALWTVMTRVREAASDPNQSTTYDLGPLRTHLSGVTHAPVLREGWEWVAQVEQMRGDRSAARAALMLTWPHVAEADRIGWARQSVYSFFSMRDELDSAERQFTLAIAKTSLELGKQQRLNAPRMAVLHVTHARALAMNDRTSAAIDEARRALELEPDMTEALTFLGWLEKD